MDAQPQSPAVIYELIFGLETKSILGNGRKAWRLCHAIKVFAPSELSRITPEGEMLLVAGYRFTSQGAYDAVDEYGARTRVTFYFQVHNYQAPRVIKHAGRQVPCVDGLVDFSDTAFLAELKNLGFELTIQQPEANQPTTLPR